MGDNKIPALVMIEPSTGRYYRLKYFKESEDLRESLNMAQYAISSGEELPTL